MADDFGIYGDSKREQAQGARLEREHLDALLAVVALLDGTAWDADTLGAVADVLRTAGFEIREPTTS
jgi:hypothetical protein